MASWTRTFEPMEPIAKQVDRLLPRHPAPNRLSLQWNVRMERAGRLKKEEVNTAAQVVDLSLDGALVEVYGEETVANGDRIRIRFRGLDGEVVVKHSRKGAPGRFLYGIQIIQNHELKDAIDLVVGEIRGHSPELSQAWQRQN